MLVGATVSSVVGVWLTGDGLAYVAAVLWALAAVVVATAQRDAPGLAGTAGAGLAVVLVAVVPARRRRAG